jgi:DNA polymerase I
MIALIDGDVLAYQACRPRWREKVDKQLSLDANGKVVTANVVNIDEEGYKIPIEYTRAEDEKYLVESWQAFKSKLKNLLDEIYATEYLMAVKGEGNYRDLLYKEYKMNRKKNPYSNQLKAFVPDIRRLAVESDMAVYAHGREADDLIRIWANQCRYLNKDYTIVSIDKDLKCIPGKHYFMHPNLADPFVTVSEDEARLHYYAQLIQGDPTDNIPGVPRMGPVKARKIVESCTSEAELQEAVVEQYYLAYGEENWFNYFLVNAKLIHIQEHMDDYFDAMSWPIIRELI